MQLRPGSRSTALATCFFALVLTATGCAAFGAGAGRHADAVVPIPTVLDSSHLALPIESYMFTDRDMTTLQQAQAVLTEACMKRLGFDWHTTAPESDTDTVDAANTAHRYGLTDPQAAMEYGYHYAGPGSGTPNTAAGAKLSAAEAPPGARASPRAAPPRGAPLRGAPLRGAPLRGAPLRGAPLRGAQAPLSAAEASALTGVVLDGNAAPTVYRGIAIPAGGCLGQATVELSGTPGVLGDGELVTNINIGSYNQSYSEARVTAVFRSWSGCMKTAGFDYPNPSAAPGNDPKFSGATPTVLEIAIAKSDVACKRQANLVGIWYAVDSAYQQVAIAQNAKTLAGIRQHNAAELAKARAILSDVPQRRGPPAPLPEHS